MDDMDQADELDALFSEENLNNASLGGGILSENVILNENIFVPAPSQTSHLSDLTSDGALNKLFWSKAGVIARIVNDATAVELTAERVNPKTSEWVLIKPRQLDTTFEDIITLAWSFSGYDLAVFDRKGRVYIYNLYPAAALKLNLAKDGLNDEADERNQPVGVLWLHQSRPGEPRKNVLEQTKTKGQWVNETIQGNFYPPHGIRAVCTINRMATFTIHFMRDAAGYRLATLALPMPSSPSILTHAALCQTPNGSLVAAVATTAGHLCAFMITMTFTSNEPLPVLNTELIDPRIAGTPPFVSVDALISGDPSDCWLLTHLQMIQEPEFDLDHMVPPPPKHSPTIVASYTTYDNQKNAANDNIFGQSVIKRWRIEQSRFELHSVFGDPNGSVEPSQMKTHQLPDTLFPAPVTNFQLIEPGNVLAVTLLEGSTSFWSAYDMTMYLESPDPQMVASIGQLSLEFPPLVISTTQCISPHSLIIANNDIEGNLKLSKPKYRSNKQNNYVNSNTTSQPDKHELDPSSPTDAALIAGYILSFSRSCWMNSILDDITSSIDHTLTPTSLIHLRRQLFTTLFQPKALVPGPSNISDVEKVPHQLIVLRALSFHFSLFKPYPSHLPPPYNTSLPRTDKIAHLWAWTVLNLRWSIMLIGDAYKSFPHPSQQLQQQNTQGQNQAPAPQPTLPPSFLELVSSNIRWTFNLFTYILSHTLSTASRRTSPTLYSAPSFATLLGDHDGTGSQGLISLLLNCTWSRSFLTIMARLMRACATKGGVHVVFGHGSRASVTQGPNTALAGTTLHRVANTIFQCCLKHGITVNALEAVLDAKYHPDWWRDDEQQNYDIYNRQIEMMVTGVVGEEYKGTARRILDGCINGSSDDVEGGAGGESLRARGELDRYRIESSCPVWGEVWLNGDDVAFEWHQAVFGRDGQVQGGESGDVLKDVGEEQEEGHGQTGGETVNRVENGSGAGKNGKPARVLWDIHKKMPLFSIGPTGYATKAGEQQQGQGLPNVCTTEEMLVATVRRCVRCGSLSDSMMEGGYRGWPRSSLMLLNRCVCDGGWVVEEVREGLAL